ncbi:MFS transporter [Pontiellaceae bacterium B12219]|nr:MFS transporter [Pontiellaceae bacterium B12219]
MDTAGKKAKLTFKTKMAYGLGNVSVMIAKQAPKRLCFPIYNLAFGVSTAWIGALFSLMRIWDAFTDPLIGHISDNWSGRFGRRKPFIVGGALLTGIFFAALWLLPRGLSPVSSMVYLSVICLLFYTALTIFSVPWYAMGYELTDDFDERTRLFAFPSFFGPISQIGVGWLYFLTQRSFFEDTIEGVRYVGLFTGIILIIFGLLPVFFVKESSPHIAEVLAEKKNEKKKKKSGLITNLKESLTCTPFLIVSISVTLVLMASAIVGGLHYYINIYYVYGGDKAAASTTIGWYWTAVYVVAALIVPLVSKLAIRFGKKAVFQGALFWGVGLMGLRWFLYTPNSPYLQLLDGVLYAFLDASVFLLCQSMIADVCDYDEVNHGSRREGVFAAVYGWLFKTGLALGALVAGLLLAKIGFDKKVIEVPSAEVLTQMRVFFSVVPGVAFLIAGLICCFYPLSKKRMTEIRAQLELNNQ